MGFCGLDPHRLPLVGDEIRPCWEPGPLPASPTIPAAATPDDAGAMPPLDRPTTSRASLAGSPPRRAFVEVGTMALVPPAAMLDGPVEPAIAAPAVPAPRWSLWED